MKIAATYFADTSFEIMRIYGISGALTADHHFEQAGFTALLLVDPAATHG